jgi:integrase
MFVDRKYVRKSTKTADRKEALAFAKAFYDSIRISQRLDISVHTDTFFACAEHLRKRQEMLVATGQRDKRILSEDERKLRADILPFFGTKGVADITASTLDEYVAYLASKKQIKPTTISKHLVVVRKVLVEAQRRNFIKAIPPFPTFRVKDNPRPYFTEDEYRKLRSVAKRLAKEGAVVRGVPFTEEMYDFIVFAMNVFVRPSDLKLLRHRDIQVVTDKRERGSVSYLTLIPQKSKTVVRESISMPRAAVAYERIRRRAEVKGTLKASDFVFFAQYPNRSYALQTIRRQFEFLLEQAGLRQDRLGRNRTLYSLRHSALMYRFLHGDNVDIFVLARNALTSVDQLERFYLSHAASRDKIETLHSFARRG